jgi:hypothetical protein
MTERARRRVLLARAGLLAAASRHAVAHSLPIRIGARIAPTLQARRGVAIDMRLAVWRRSAARHGRLPSRRDIPPIR